MTEPAVHGDGWYLGCVVQDLFGCFGHLAISEPRQAEGVTSFLIVGSKRAVLLDSGLGVGRISGVVQRLTTLPVVVINSHTHFDHVGGNSEFADCAILRIEASITKTQLP